jgi:uncharacterized NAD-dependent epimerase/dehydratase family protein
VKDDRIAIYAEGLFETGNGKAAHGLIRYGRRKVVCVVDSTTAGLTASDVVPYTRHPVPIVATIAEAVALGATCLAIGVAPTGGRLPAAWKEALLEALGAGLDCEAGLHDELQADPDLVAAAASSGAELRDLRAVPPDLSTPTGEGIRAPVRIVHIVGSDCAIGKMTAALELTEAAREAGHDAVFVATGQVGISISGWGIAVDHVISDYVNGAAERLVLDGARRGNLLIVEGQGALQHPAYSGVTLGLLHGCTPHVLVLVHDVGTTHVDDWEHVAIPPLGELCDLFERLAEPIRPARVAAIALNTRRLADDGEARAATARIEAATGRVCDDPVRFGSARLWSAVEAALP